MQQTWEEANEWERQWHGNCANTFNEESKQYAYAHYMGLDEYATNYYGQRGWDFGDKKILDCGCGPCSLLLKSKGTLLVGVDPCKYPDWVMQRYAQCGIIFLNHKAEDVTWKEVFDEVLLYNCLQHVDDPEKIINNLLESSKIIRVFEWVDNGISEGHIHNLTEEKLNTWLDGEGKIINIDRNPVVGKAYVGVFKGNHYGE